MASPEEELQKFRSLIGATNQTAVNAPPDIEASAVADPDAALQRFRELTSLPASQNAVNQVRGVEAVPNLSFTERQARRDPDTGELIPISNEGIGAAYWRVAMQRGPEAQMAVLSKMYPNSQPRQLENGSVAVTITDSATGKPKEVIVNPVGPDSSDLIDLAAQMPEIAAGVATAIMTRGTGFLKTTAQMVLSSLAASGAGAVKDVSARASEGIDLRLGEIAASRTGEAALDLFLQAGMLGGAKTMRGISPFASEVKPDTLVFDSQKARQFFQREFGEEIPMFPSEVTGSSMLQAIEAVEGTQPGARTVMQRLRDQRSEKVRNIMDRALGNIESEEAIGVRSVSALRGGVVLPIEQSLEAARTAAINKSNARLTQLLDDISMPSSGRTTSSQAGETTIAAFNQRLEQAQAKVDAAYAVVNDLPGGTGDVLGGTPAARAAADIRKELPQVLKTKKKETSLVDEFGRQMTKEVKEREVLESGVPPGLLKALDDLESLKGGKVSLQTLTNMKRAAYDEIAKTEAVPGVKERWFNKIAAAYERGIQEGIEETGDPQLKAALTNAKEVYKKELLPFDRPGVKEIAREEFDAGRLSPEQVATRLFEGPKAIENMRMLKEVLGADNPAFRVLKRAWIDNQLFDDAVLDRVTGEVDAKALAQKMMSFSKRPEIEQEMFGNKLPEILSQLRYQQIFKNLKSLDETEVRTLLNLKNPTASDLDSLIRMQKNRDSAYANSIIKDVADGVLEGKPINPTEFVKRLTNAKTPSAEIEKVLTDLERIDPQTRSAIATATMYKLLDAATTAGPEAGARALRGGALDISPTKLRDAIGRMETDERKRIELLLGNEALPIVPGQPGPTRGEVLENLVMMLSPQEVKSKTMGTAGGLAAGANILSLMKSPFQYATSYAQKLAASTIWTDKAFTKLISNRVYGPAESAALANALIASEPFVRRMTEVLGDETMAGTIVNELKESIDRYVQGQIDSPAGRERAEVGRLLRGEEANVTIQPMR